MLNMLPVAFTATGGGGALLELATPGSYAGIADLSTWPPEAVAVGGRSALVTSNALFRLSASRDSFEKRGCIPPKMRV